jgi:alanine dehydrogenase
MRIGTVKEIKKHEYRVGMTPKAAEAYVKHGHQVFVQKGAGEGSAWSDELYQAAGCKIFDQAKDVFDASDMIVKVK